MQLDSAFARYRRGRDVAALGEVFDLAAPEVLRIATYLVRDAGVAEDLVQQTILSVIEGSDRFKDGRAVMPWMLGILANHVRAHTRREARAPDAARLAARNVDDPARRAEDREVESAVRTAIDELDEPYREILRMSLDEGLAPREIAASLDRPQGTVRSQLHRGLDLLRKALPVGLSLGVVSRTHGLAAVREQVLAEADRWGGGVGAAALKGGVLVSKKSVAVVAAVLLVAAWLAWEWSVRSDKEEGPTRTAETHRQATSLGAGESERAGAVGPSGTPASQDVGAAVEPAPALVVRVRLGGEPAVGAGVFLAPWTGGDPRAYRQFTITDARGHASFPSAPEGTAMVMSLSGAVGRVRPQESRSLDLAGEPGVSVRGRVVDEGGRAIADARIEASRRGGGLVALPVARSDAEGRFLVRHLSAVHWYLTARAPGYRAAPLQHVNAPRGDELQMTLRLGDAAGEALLVVRDTAGRPVPSAVVFMGDPMSVDANGRPPIRSEPGADGTARLVGIEPGERVWMARAPGYRPQHGTLTISAGARTEQAITLERSAVVTGRVRWENGDPVANGSVRERANARPKLLHARVLTDADGRFRIDEIAAEEFTLEVRHAGFAPVEGTFRLAPGQEVDWPITLGARHELRGTLVDEQGKPLAGWFVRATSSTRVRASGMTGEDGAFSIGVSDPEATYRVEAIDPSVGRPAAGAEAKGTREPVSLVVRRPRLARVTGRLLDADGKPVGGVYVLGMAEGSPATRGEPTAHKDGSFALQAGRSVPCRFYVYDESGKYPFFAGPERKLVVGETIDLGTLRLPRGGRLRLVKRAPDGMEQFRAGPQIVFGLPLKGWQREDPDAPITPRLAPGIYTVNASGVLDGKWVQRTVEAEVFDGKTVDVIVDMR
ncbi:MAG: sigma-70 family RNA polymerase sigma factor [Planctomycetota bacterium]